MYTVALSIFWLLSACFYQEYGNSVLLKFGKYIKFYGAPFSLLGFYYFFLAWALLALSIHSGVSPLEHRTDEGGELILRDSLG